MKTKEYRLCGGTLFALLNQSKKTTTRIPLGNAEQITVTDSLLLAEFIKIFNPDFSLPSGKSFSTVCNKFKSCQSIKSSYLPFDDSTLMAIFENEYNDNYLKQLARVVDFTNIFIMSRQMPWLVCSILELIESDTSILSDEVIYKTPDGVCVTKEMLNSIDEVILQPLILGLMHYIVSNRPDNTIGQDTFNDWFTSPDSKGGRYVFTSDIGTSLNRTIGVLEIADRNSMRMRRLYPSDHILPMSQDMPDRTTLYVVPSQLLTPKDEYTEYLNQTRDKYSKVSTLLYNDEPRPFYSFYIPNDIVRGNSYRSFARTKDTLSIDYLLRMDNRFSIITGTGGLGKSMLMRHILLTAIGRYDVYNYVPIFIALKDYDDSYEDIFSFVFSKYKNLAGAKDKTAFEQLLKYGKCLLLLDGLDEINTEYLQKFEKDLETFVDQHSRNKIIISSRPAGDFLAYSRFSVYNLQPFTKEKALALIDKLEFRPDEPEFKQKFRDLLDKKLYNTQKEFAQNPLLLTIMLMTFEQYGEIPSKMHVFYSEAYTALSQKHDANKGGYKRKFDTNLTPDDMATYFSEFCAQTYCKEMYELSDNEFDRVYNNLNIIKAGSNVPSSAFKKDLTKALCLMYYESTKYHFTHRSFQEYFCALYFSKQKDKSLGAIGNFFESKKTRIYSDKTFGMLYDMIPEKVEEYIFLPIVENLVNECADNEGYITFLEKMYPTINYEDGETPDIYINLPQSYIYSFIISNFFKPSITVDDVCHPFVDDFVTDEMVFIESNWELEEDEYGHSFRNPEEDPEMTLVSRDEIDINYFDHHEDPDTVGWLLSFSPSDVLRNKDKYPEMADFITNKSYPLMAEYIFIQDYYKKILENARKSEADDLFSSFI